MDFFFSHIAYILIAAVVIAGLAGVWAVALMAKGSSANKERGKEQSDLRSDLAESRGLGQSDLRPGDSDPENPKQIPGCAGCPISEICGQDKR